MLFKKGQCYVFLGRLGEWRCYLYGSNTLLACFGNKEEYTVECPAWNVENSREAAIFIPLKEICVRRGILEPSGFRPRS